MQRYMIDTGTYGNGYSAEPDEDGPFVYADEAEARIAALESQLSDRHAERVREIDAHMERVAGLEAKLAQYRWRRVEDELPDAETYVLTFDCGYLIETYVDDEGVWWSKEFDAPIHGVKVWMPLPPAPQEGE